jgi:carboxynorspermidine decarboxylase
MPTSVPTIQQLIEEQRGTLKTPYYLIDETRMLINLEKIAQLRERTGVKSVLALKCFAGWSAFDLIRRYLDGTTSSSVYEAQLGHEKFGKEVHAYSVAFSDEDVKTVRRFATKIIFNSVSQLKRFHSEVSGTPVGLRLNPGVSFSPFELADPARACSRLGATNLDEVERVSELIRGLMFHCNCENDDYEAFAAILDHIARRFAPLLTRMEWVSLGGGISFTEEGYAFDAFCDKIRSFAQRFGVQVYLEPGEAVVAHSGFLVTTVLDVVHNDQDIAIVDAGVEPHMLDLLTYRMTAKVAHSQPNGRSYIVAGRTCLAGDIFGTYTMPPGFGLGSLIAFEDAAGYTMVKKNWFNGIPMPSIVVRRLDGRIEVVKEFGYDDFLQSLS